MVPGRWPEHSGARLLTARYNLWTPASDDGLSVSVQQRFGPGRSGWDRKAPQPLRSPARRPG